MFVLWSRFDRRVLFIRHWKIQRGLHSVCFVYHSSYNCHVMLRLRTKGKISFCSIKFLPSNSTESLISNIEKIISISVDLHADD